MQIVSGKDLASMSIEELTRLCKELPEITEKQKRNAWRKMDTGVYNEQGDLIGETFEDEDTYE